MKLLLHLKTLVNFSCLRIRENVHQQKSQVFNAFVTKIVYCWDQDKEKIRNSKSSKPLNCVLGFYIRMLSCSDHCKRSI